MNAKTKTKTIVGYRLFNESLSYIANKSIQDGAVSQLYRRTDLDCLDKDNLKKTRITITVTVEDL